MKPNEPHQRFPDFESELLQLLREISHKLDALRDQLASRPESAPNRTRDVLPDLEELPLDKLYQRLAEARQANEAYDVLDIRRILVERLADDDRIQLDRELAQWFTSHFHNALRAGHAAIVVGAIERAVEDIGDIPEMELLAESLPTVLRSVGLYIDLQRERDES